jgi:hypothetical protein
MLKMGGVVGHQGLADGVEAAPRLGNNGEMIVGNLHGRYYEQVKRGNVYGASNQAAQAVSVALATTYTGLILSNPPQSGKNIVLLSVGYALSVAPAAIASIHLIGGWQSTDITHTAAVSPRSMLLNNANATNAVAKVDSQATIPTPTYLMSLMSGFTAGALPASPAALFDIAGQFVITPGGFIAIGALTAITGFGSFVWEEVSL